MSELFTEEQVELIQAEWATTCNDLRDRAFAAEHERDTLREALHSCAEWPLERSRFDLTRYARGVLASLSVSEQATP